MEMYIAVLEEDARQAGKDPDFKAVSNRDKGMRKEYELACLLAQDCLAEHQNMSDIRNGLSIDDTQRSQSRQDDCHVPRRLQNLLHVDDCGAGESFLPVFLLKPAKKVKKINTAKRKV